MKEHRMVDRVIGTKECIRCGYPVSVEAYSVKDAQARLDEHRSCCNGPCGSTGFTNPKINVIMKPYKKWLNPLLKRMGEKP